MREDNLLSFAADFASGSDHRADLASRKLAAFGSQNLESYHQLLDDQRADVRWWAIRSLAYLKSPEITPLLVHSLEDVDISVRQCAALALQKQPDACAVPALIAQLDSSDQLLRRIAGDALVAVGSESVPALLEVMQDSSQEARIEAARALALIGDTRAVPQLFKALDEESALLEHWAGEGLERMGIGMVFFSP